MLVLLFVVLIGQMAMAASFRSDLLETADAQITSATLYIFVNWANRREIAVHRITSDWDEMTVTWNSFNNSYDGEEFGSFIADAGWVWRSVDITTLVQHWINGDYENYGFLLNQVNYEYPQAVYHSRENAINQPYLEICYSTAGETFCETISPVVDTTIQENLPDANYGDWIYLWTGVGIETIYEKHPLIRFEIEPKQGSGTGTPGYWMNHPEAWPVEEIVIGCITYSKDEAIGHIQDPVKRDKTYTLFPALVAAKLNIMIGNDDSCIADTIGAADEWMASNPVGSGVTASSEAWQNAEPLYLMMDDYNNGFLCAPSRD